MKFLRGSGPEYTSHIPASAPFISDPVVEALEIFFTLILFRSFILKQTNKNKEQNKTTTKKCFFLLPDTAQSGQISQNSIGAPGQLLRLSAGCPCSSEAGFCPNVPPRGHRLLPHCQVAAAFSRSFQYSLLGVLLLHCGPCCGELP